jgi:predicted transcriptional regulator
MKSPCEVMSIKVLPGLRAIVATKLVEKHEFSQKAAAERLGTTQPAISQYRSMLRGNNNGMLKDDPAMMEIIDSIAEKAAKGDGHESLVLETCRVCTHLRSNGAMCEIHRKMYPSLEGCKLCQNSGEGLCWK